MKVIFTKSSLPLSVVIRGILSEPVSHFGIVFDNGIIFHSNLLGTHIEWYGSFKKHCEIVYEIEYPMTLEQEEAVYQSILTTYDDHGYDYGALFYFGYRALLFRIFGIALPKKNEWAQSDKFLCTELVGTLPDYILPLSVKTEDLSLTSPYKLYLQLEAAKVIKE